MSLKNIHIASLLLIVFFAGIIPQQYFIFLHDHEHKNHRKADEGAVFDEKLHDCSDQLNYLSTQTDIADAPLVVNSPSGNFGLCCVYPKRVSLESMVKKGRAPPFNG